MARQRTSGRPNCVHCHRVALYKDGTCTQHHGNKPALPAGEATAEVGRYRRSHIFRKVSRRDFETLMVACRLFGKDPADLIREFVDTYLTGLRERITIHPQSRSS